ncbi:MAG: DUF1653 domain-containing protein [Clostridia bacterium]|nr:DUF1653 domain-containing protein [Clostridia bacterium]
MKLNPFSMMTRPDGTIVFVIAVCNHSETKEELVIYKTINSEGKTSSAYACPKDIFMDDSFDPNDVKCDIESEPYVDEITERSIEAYSLWNHFKGARSLVITRAINIITGEKLVLYRCLDNKGKTNHRDGVYARPEEMFSSLVDPEKYPERAGEYRFVKDMGIVQG